jgi:hypothetical protein
MYRPNLGLHGAQFGYTRRREWSQGIRAMPGGRDQEDGRNLRRYSTGVRPVSFLKSLRNRG